jgi:serine/threonine protein kinase/WD40 repeat protein
MRDPLIGTRINRYEVREAVHKSDLIGIYKAYDTKLERYVLLKTILHSVDYSREAVDYFLAESRTLAKLVHPNIAKVLDFGYENGNLYLISEFVSGRSLSELMNQPMPWQHAINILLPLADALIYAHSRGILHRDLKPDNIIINTDNQPILSDFSLMRIIEEEETRDMTGTNVGLGSPGYISPEQGQGLTVDFRSDIYSLGVIFFEMVTGKKLFYATSSMEIVIQHIMADPPKPRTIIPDLPRAVETIILNAVSKDREKRYQSMEDFSNALKAVVDAANKAQKAGPRRSRTLIAATITGVTLLIAGALYAFRVPLGLAPSTTITSTLVPTQQAGTPTPSNTPTSIPITRTPTAIVTATSDESSTFFQLPDLPVLPGEKLPAGHAGISPENAASLVELARWGIPDITQMTYVNEGKTILAATSAGVYLFSPGDLSAEHFFDTAGSLTVLAVSDDGEWLATGDDRGSVAVWNIRDGQLLYKLNDKAKRIVSLDFSPDKTKLVFCDTDKNIHLWGLRPSGYAPFEKRHTLNINKVMFLSDNQTVLSGGDDFQVMIWDAPSGKWLGQFPAAQKINDMSLSPDGKYLALALNDATLQVFDFPARQPVNRISDRAIIAPFTHIHFLPNSVNFVTASADGFVRIWSAAGPGFIWESNLPEQGGGPIETVAITQSGSNFAVGFKSGWVEVWDLATKTRDASRDLRSASINRIVISPDDRLLAYQWGDAAVEVMSIANSSEHTQVAGRLPRGNPISPSSRMIGIQSGELNLYSLSATRLTPLYTLYGFPTNGTVNYSADDKLITAYAGGIFNYWSTASGMALKPSLLKTQGRCLTIYRQDESFIAAGSEIGVLHADAHLPEFCRISRGARTTSEEFLPDGSIIAISLQNQLIELWDLDRDDQKINLTTRTPGHVMDVSLSNDGRLLAAASSGGVIEIYDLETLNLLKMLEVRTGPVNQVLFSNDSRYLIAGLSDGTLRFFGLQP